MIHGHIHRGNMRDDSVEILFQSFLWEALVSSFGIGRDVYSLTAFPLPTAVSPTLQGALKDGFGEVVMVRDMPEPYKFSSLDNIQKRFEWAHKEVVG